LHRYATRHDWGCEGKVTLTLHRHTKLPSSASAFARLRCANY
jgi:hypothetical protein